MKEGFGSSCSVKSLPFSSVYIVVPPTVVFFGIFSVSSSDTLGSFLGVSPTPSSNAFIGNPSSTFFIASFLKMFNSSLRISGIAPCGNCPIIKFTLSTTVALIPIAFSRSASISSISSELFVISFA